MAFDEALLKTTPLGCVTLRTYSWDPPCLSLGCFQKYSEVNVEKTKELGFDVVRRPTGGRAVLHDQELTYCIVTKPPHPILEQKVLDSYYHLCQGIVMGLNYLGVNASLKKSEDKELSTPSCFAAPTFNDIEAGGKKLVGSAQMRNSDGMLQHGSILIDVNLLELFSVITCDQSSAKKLADLSSAKITSINTQLGRKAILKEVKDSIIRGFSDSLGASFESYEPNSEFYDIMYSIEKDKYLSKEWNENR
jgi:lipoate-protein ligase A